MDRIALLNRLKLHEGFRAKAYKDTNDHLTIGYGRNLESVGISQAEAEMLLEHDLEAAIEGAKSLIKNFDSLSGPRQEVVVEMTFNMGVATFSQFKRTIAYIEAGEYKSAADAMLESLWARQVKGRANELAQIMWQG